MMENEIKIREKYRSKISQYKLSLTRSNHLLKNSIRQSKSELRQIKEQNQYNQKKYMDMIEATFSHEEICFLNNFFKEQDAKLEQLINETLDERNEFVHSEPSISELNETMSFEKINDSKNELETIISNLFISNQVENESNKNSLNVEQRTIDSKNELETIISNLFISNQVENESNKNSLNVKQRTIETCNNTVDETGFNFEFNNTPFDTISKVNEKFDEIGTVEPKMITTTIQMVNKGNETNLKKNQSKNEKHQNVNSHNESDFNFKFDEPGFDFEFSSIQLNNEFDPNEAEKFVLFSDNENNPQDDQNPFFSGVNNDGNSFILNFSHDDINEDFLNFN
ncbi:hypothetical protein BLOT_003194, partial [Blomia tropicalis]